MQRFVVLTSQRSGSNMLRSLLNEHPEVTCFGELMRRTPRRMRSQGYRGALRTLERVDEKYRTDSVRFGHPREFVDDVMAKLATTPIVGFKLMLNQHPGFMSELISDPTYAKILLYRANHLASFSSEKIARATGQGAARTGMDIKRAKVRFRKGEFRRFLKTREEKFEDVRKQLAGAGGGHFEIEYLELVEEEDGIARVLKFLGAESACEIKPRTVRRNPTNLLERFNNPEDVLKELASMGAERWATEQEDTTNVPSTLGQATANRPDF
jgi:LPS sulfotransferase NodH